MLIIPIAVFASLSLLASVLVLAALVRGGQAESSHRRPTGGVRRQRRPRSLRIPASSAEGRRAFAGEA